MIYFPCCLIDFIDQTSFEGRTFPLVFNLTWKVYTMNVWLTFIPWIDHNLEVKIFPVHLLGVTIIDPLRPCDVRQMLEHYQVLTLGMFLVPGVIKYLFIQMMQTWITACLSFSCWPLFLLSLHAGSILMFVKMTICSLSLTWRGCKPSWQGACCRSWAPLTGHASGGQWTASYPRAEIR